VALYSSPLRTIESSQLDGDDVKDKRIVFSVGKTNMFANMDRIQRFLWISVRGTNCFPHTGRLTSTAGIWLSWLMNRIHMLE
jgi:hypothetical protein